MGTDPAPNHMGLASVDRDPVLEGGSTVRCPGHLEDSNGALDASNPEARAEAFATLKVFNELLHCFPEAFLILLGELCEVLPKSRKHLVGRHSVVCS